MPRGSHREQGAGSRASQRQRPFLLPGPRSLGGGLCVPAMVLCCSERLCVSLPLSTIFLMGPLKQLKRMFEPTRLIATILVLVSAAALRDFSRGHFYFGCVE